MQRVASISRVCSMKPDGETVWWGIGGDEPVVVVPWRHLQGLEADRLLVDGGMHVSSSGMGRRQRGLSFGGDQSAQRGLGRGLESLLQQPVAADTPAASAASSPPKRRAETCGGRGSAGRCGSRRTARDRCCPDRAGTRMARRARPSCWPAELHIARRAAQNRRPLTDSHACQPRWLLAEPYPGGRPPGGDRAQAAAAPPPEADGVRLLGRVP